ncbi:hydroxyacid dehydrogenase [Streptomyces sp. NPDC005890]|uniref:hydroxyacid dehydrogenase n=1 Tax=Streptomyces sp. NPDC005890 TaxID=3154568 RepID=UPI00340BACD1
MTSRVVLVADPLPAAALERLGPGYEVRHCDGADRARLLAAVAEADALLVRSATTVDAEVLAAAPRLAVVGRAGVGVDNIDVAAATAAGVVVVNAPAANVVSAAELTCGLLLAAARDIQAAGTEVKSGVWRRSTHVGTELAGKTLGIVGLGRIGLAVARRMAAFDMTVLGHDPYATAETADQHGIKLVPLEELLARSDFITVHVPRTPQTVGLIGEAELRLVKPTAYLANVARGGIVDEAALYTALRESRLAGAALDVFDDEPCTDSPLLGLDNVTVTPHLGASTREAQERAATDVIRALVQTLGGEPAPEALNAPRSARG